jgi:fermentation-respiration switch protein FrsA (DUF1100 family)
VGTERQIATAVKYEERVSFSNPRGDTLAGVVHHPDERRPRAGALLCHGMESDKNSEKIISLSRELAARGILTLRFDFSYVGESSGKFEDLTYTGEVEDLASAFAFVRSFPVTKIGLLGSSMGGTVALLFAAREKAVTAIAAIAAPLHPEKITESLLSPEQVEQWRSDGFISFHGQRINVSLLEDLDRLDVARQARQIACPVLIVHGDRDETVPVREAHELHDLLAAPKRLVVLPGADHRLSDPSHLAQAMKESLEWFSRYLH